MSCSELMYQFYPSAVPHRTVPESLRYGSQTLDYTTHTGSYPYLGDSRTVSKREVTESATYDPESEPRGSQYLNANCLLLTYFHGDTSTVVDEHFSRALSQPSSFSSDRNGNPSLNTKRQQDTNLMCNRKLPPSFWISDYQPPRPAYGSQDFSRDLYSASSWYNWPYHFPPSSYPSGSEFSRPFPYSPLDPMSKLSPTYQSLMLRSGFESRNSKYDRTKIPESLSTPSSYYGLRLGADLSSANMNFEPSTPGLDYSLQTMRKELCW
ncbi:transcription cofactor vestigial-like protein 2 [Mytilus galloprovincialis]|uniref:Transcription cofactor vestigial-like protein 2 n=1 Tax=Mytilus galloprovincialis TaxID=29158 RepID=A0A8B6ENE4_MYTGA|nr:Hypothetical predicted protein [Mytilus galloprovincialis]